MRTSEDEAEAIEGGLLPAIIFSFSKKKCEEIADHFVSQDLLTAREKGEVRAVMSSAMARYNDSEYSTN